MAYNPYGDWTKDLLEACLTAGKKYFVLQYYHRGQVNAPETVTHTFLVCHYDDFAVANHHYQIVKNIDPLAKIFDSTILEQREKLFKTTDHYSKYKFYSVAANPDWKIKLKKYERYMRTCIETELNWHPSGKSKVWVGLHAEYGQLWISFKYGSQNARFLFDDIEKLPKCAMILPYSLLSSWSPTIYQP